jgi:hypothetical protein
LNRGEKRGRGRGGGKREKGRKAMGIKQNIERTFSVLYVIQHDSIDMFSYYIM